MNPIDDNVYQQRVQQLGNSVSKYWFSLLHDVPERQMDSLFTGCRCLLDDPSDFGVDPSLFVVDPQVYPDEIEAGRSPDRALWNDVLSCPMDCLISCKAFLRQMPVLGLFYPLGDGLFDMDCVFKGKGPVELEVGGSEFWRRVNEWCAAQVALGVALCAQEVVIDDPHHEPIVLWRNPQV